MSAVACNDGHDTNFGKLDDSSSLEEEEEEDTASPDETSMALEEDMASFDEMSILQGEMGKGKVVSQTLIFVSSNVLAVDRCSSRVSFGTTRRRFFFRFETTGWVRNMMRKLMRRGGSEQSVHGHDTGKFRDWFVCVCVFMSGWFASLPACHTQRFKRSALFGSAVYFRFAHVRLSVEQTKEQRNMRRGIHGFVYEQIRIFVKRPPEPEQSANTPSLQYSSKH